MSAWTERGWKWGEMSTRRIARVNDLIREQISELLLREIKDPRLEGLLSVTEVATSADLRHATVFFSLLGSEDEKRQVEEGLAAASGFIRRGLGERLSLRYTPELVFRRDESIERGTRILDLIDKVARHESSDKAD